MALTDWAIDIPYADDYASYRYHYSGNKRQNGKVDIIQV